ncbi:histidinol-phosphate transaminase [Ancylobacter sp. VNQ12]|uniref:histidinol-phosphate transaminase n=1 Tax=Ancylobacter sp. VNQ12 TaxID=3400920 RepID=UPI003C0208D5
MTYERPHIAHMAGYIPGTQPGTDAVKLNTNENPFPPSPRVMAGLADIAGRALQRYPDPLAGEFRRVAARRHGLTPEQVIATNGGDELLRLVLTTFVDPGRPVGVVAPSYGVYSVLADVHQAPLSTVSLTDAWHLPDEAADLWNADGAQLVILTNPHAPSGKLAPIEAIERLASALTGVLLIDEAYVDFVDPALAHDATKLIERHPNLLLLRSLSKGYSLAGLRVGYGLGDAALVAPMLAKTKDSYNVDAIAQTLGSAALDDIAHATASWDFVREQRRLLAQRLITLDFDVGASEANFLLASVPADPGWRDAKDLHAKLESRGIYVRWFDEDRLRDRLRISIGTQEENWTLVRAIEELRG